MLLPSSICLTSSRLARPLWRPALVAQVDPTEPTSPCFYKKRKENLSA